MESFSVNIRKIEKPFKEDVESNLRWILMSLGISEKSAEDYARIVSEIAKMKREGKNIGSLELSSETGKKRGTTIYCLNKLCSMGFIVRRGRTYTLRSGNITRTVREIFKDIERIFNEIEEISRDVDKKLGLPG